ncbi:MAG: hypothetical protein N3B18_06445 [Desulfobacterota bacterium]|nr:hypothetical protein [Thermodesulfobacteriota bacterium]
MKKIALFFTLFICLISSGAFALEEAVLESSEDIMYCYADGSCVPVGNDNPLVSEPTGKMATYSTLPPTLTLTQLNFVVKNTSGQFLSNRCVGVPVTLTTITGGQTTTEQYIFWSMPTDVLGKISVVLARSGITNTCNGTTYKMTFTTSGLSVTTPINNWPMGCCQITLTCGITFCYSAPNINGYAECLCNKLDKIFRCLGIGAASWSPGYKCNYQTGLCEGGTLIELSRFEAHPLNKAVRIEWSTEAEINSGWFNILRSEAPDGQYAVINTSPIVARGSAFEGKVYEFVDTTVRNRKTYYYKLEEITLDGESTMYGPVSATPSFLSGFFK